MDFLKKVKGFAMHRFRNVRKYFLRTYYYNRYKVLLPEDFTLGNNVRFSLLKDSMITIQGKLDLGDYTLIKAYNPLSIFIIGKCLTTRMNCSFQLFGGELVTGDNISFNNNCSVSCFGKIEIGDNTIFGEDVKMYDHNHKHEFREANLYTYPNEFTIGEIKIGKNCWIGSNVTILNNVTIGDNVIIGAGCLIYKSIPANSIVKHKEDLIINQHE